VPERAPERVPDRAPEREIAPKAAGLAYVSILDGGPDPDSLGKMCEKMVRDNAAALGIELPQRFHRKVIVRYLGSKRFASETGVPETVPGLTNFQYGSSGCEVIEVFVNGHADADLKSVFRHELMHAVLGHTIGKPLPRWLDEGIAMYVESSNEKKRFDEMFAAAKTAMTLRDLMDAGTEYPKDRASFYAHSGIAVSELAGRYGLAKVYTFLDKGVVRKDWDAASRAAFGKSLATIESEVDRALEARRATRR
jgi:hypothetical protein